MPTDDETRRLNRQAADKIIESRRQEQRSGLQVGDILEQAINDKIVTLQIIKIRDADWK